MTIACQLSGGQPSRVIPGGATWRTFVFLAAGHLAAAAGATADDASNSWQDSAQLGLLRSGSLRGSAAALDENGDLIFGSPGILSPLPNDTISEEYWARVNRAIQNAGRATTPPATLNDPSSTPTPEPWKKIFGASEKSNVLDAKQAQGVLSSWEYATPQPFSTQAQFEDRALKSINVVPYDMQLGARIMYGLSAKNPATPPPTQSYVDASFMAQCPMIMFTGTLEVTPPRCSKTKFGSWTDPKTGRAILRWNVNSGGGLFYGVDSVVSGDGSVKFAEFREQFSLRRTRFELLNCMDVMRYHVEEKIIKVNHMSPMAGSTVRDHDISRSSQAYFYQYIMKHANGTAVGETNLFRADQGEVNFTMYKADGTAGPTFATAKRQGYWRGDQWRDCHHKRRAWRLEYPLAETNFATVATVQDLRVAAAATVTLMAYRSEGIGSDGFSRIGRGHLYLTLVKALLLIFGALILVCVCQAVIVQQRLDKRLRWICFRLETVLLPKRPVRQRSPVLNPTY